MSNKKLTAERERDVANRTYFVTLANTRFSLLRLPMMAFITAIVLGLDTYWLWSVVRYDGHVALLPLLHVHLWVIAFSLLAWMLSAFRGWVFRFQVFSTSLMGFFSVSGWIYAVSFMALLIASMVQTATGSTFPSERLALFGLLGFLWVCGAFVVHVVLLRKRLREGYSAERTMGNVVAASRVYKSKSLWIIFAVVVIVPNILTQGEYVTMTLGVLILLFLASVCPGLTVEFAYLAFLKSKNRQYWERRPSRQVEKKERRSVVRGIVKWGVIFLAFNLVLFVLTLLSKWGVWG